MQAWTETYSAHTLASEHPPIGSVTYSGVTRAVYDGTYTFWGLWRDTPLPCNTGNCTDTPYRIQMNAAYNNYTVSGP